jgi:hypothetical protein
MSEIAITELEARRVRFFSQRDEDAFFEWLDKLSCVKGYVGRGDALHISINRAAVDEDNLRELLALFHRYGVDMKQLRMFDSDDFSEWFRDSRAYWFDSVFGDVVRSYIGKHLLVGITYYGNDGHPLRQVQVHGDIVRVDKQAITMRLHGSDDEFTLPLDLDSLRTAPEGEYRLRSTGEVVVNPDLLSTWEVRCPDDTADLDTADLRHGYSPP